MKKKETQLPEGWEVKKLGDICKIISGQSPQSKYYNSNGNGIPFYQGKKDYGVKYIGKPSKWTTKVTKLAEENDILISVRAPVGPINFSTQKICIGRGLAAIRSGQLIDKEYLFYFLKKHESEIESSSGAVFNSINRKQLERIELPLPTLPEQRRIASILDEAFAAIDQAKANAGKNLQNAGELFESYLQGVFEEGDWEEKRLQDVAKVFGRGKSKHRPRNWDGLFGGTYPFIQTGEVRNASKYITSYTKAYNEIGLAQSKLWKRGTICITIAANIAETAILDFDACIPDSIIGFEVDPKKADLNFAYYLLQYFKVELQKLGKGSAQDNINLGTFKNQHFPFPPLKEQQAIVQKIDALRSETLKLEAVYQKKIDELEELKKSILQKAFAGELATEKVEMV